MRERQARTASDVTVSLTVGHNVSRLRKAQGFNRREFAAAITAAGYPLAPPTVTTVETGKHPSGAYRSISVDALVALAMALGVRPEQLLVPFQCSTCSGKPPQGFTCTTCGATACDDKEATS